MAIRMMPMGNVHYVSKTKIIFLRRYDMMYVPETGSTHFVSYPKKNQKLGPYATHLKRHNCKCFCTLHVQRKYL